eukprot:4948_1
MIMNLCSSGDESENELDIKREHQLPPKQKKKSVKQEINANSNNNKKPKKREKISIFNHEEFATPIIKCSQTYINNLYKDGISTLTIKVDPNCAQLESKTNLNIEDAYAPKAGWSVNDGYRELYQNWYDGCNSVRIKQQNKYPYHHLRPVLHQKSIHYYFFISKKENFNIKVQEENSLIGQLALMQYKSKQTTSNSNVKEEKKTDSHTTNKLVLKNYGVALDKSCLIIGKSSKTSDTNSIGRFGEGLKMAASVLVYNKCELEINTNKKNWKSKIHKNDVVWVEPR